MLLDNQRHFGKRVKQELKERHEYCCGICGNHFRATDLEIHHNHIWVSDAKKFRIPGNFVAHPKNGKPVCGKCHDDLHRKETERPLPIVIAGIIALARETDQGKDASRVIAQISRRYRE